MMEEKVQKEDEQLMEKNEEAASMSYPMCRVGYTLRQGLSTKK